MIYRPTFMKFALEFEIPITELEEKIEAIRKSTDDAQVNLSDEIKSLLSKCEQLKKEIYGNLTPWQKVQLARHPNRPYMMDYVEAIFSEFIELHGDRKFADDNSLVAGLAVLDGISCVVIGHQKGRNLEENLHRNYGMANPEGYRKALRVMRLGEKFGMPILTFIDTPGAYPGIGAEERGQSEAIAKNLKVMSSLKVPIISTVIGEGGSGGALGIGLADRILMLENAYYSVISPEGCSAILFKDSSKAAESAEALKITADSLKEMNVVDEIIPEPLGGADKDPSTTAASLKAALIKNLKQLIEFDKEELVDQRYKKYRDIGEFKKAGRKKQEVRGKKQER